MEQWWIYRDGAIVGPVKTDLVIRGLIAGKIPHDARVRADEISEWAPILSFDAFADATQQTELIERPASMSKLEVMKPSEATRREEHSDGRFWHGADWMLLEDEHMSGPFTLAEIKKARPKLGARVCRLHTFDWLSLEEAYARGGAVPPAPGPESEPMYIVHHDDEEHGPTSLGELAKAHGQGRLGDRDRVVKFGSTESFVLGDLLRENGLSRPNLLDRTVVVARRLGSEAKPREHQRAIFFALVAVVAAALICVVALVLK